jgi:hypothetical protein
VCRRNLTTGRNLIVAPKHSLCSYHTVTISVIRTQRQPHCSIATKCPLLLDSLAFSPPLIVHLQSCQHQLQIFPFLCATLYFIFKQKSCLFLWLYSKCSDSFVIKHLTFTSSWPVISPKARFSLSKTQVEHFTIWKRMLHSMVNMDQVPNILFSIIQIYFLIYSTSMMNHNKTLYGLSTCVFRVAISKW